MTTIAPQPTGSGKNPRRGTVRSFTWTPDDGDEITACPDCAFWHAQIAIATDEYANTDVEIREWHEADCPVWQANT